MTLKEYLMDYASPVTRMIGESRIKEELKGIPNEKVRAFVERNLEKIAGGERDFRI
jgi:2-iminoacetate synthase